MQLARTLVLPAVVGSPVGDHVDDVHSFAKWAKIEVKFTGPESKGRGDPNSFAVSFDVHLISPQGVQFLVASMTAMASGAWTETSGKYVSQQTNLGNGYSEKRY